jgi:hypothetical protein
LDRDSAKELIDRHKHSDLAVITEAMPDLSPVVTYSPVGGARIEHEELQTLREAIVALAREHGMPTPAERVADFEGRGARLLHRLLPMTPHEASHEEVWSYITCCWLFDVAVWRFGASADEARFIGNLNRNTFRRMWWRAEVLGPDIDLTRLGEDELVNIMERPTIASDLRLARTLAAEFLDRVDRGSAPERMKLMREATKRLLRLTPFVAFAVLDDAEIRLLVSDTFDAASAGIAGDAIVVPVRGGDARRPASPEVTGIPTMTIAAPSGDTHTGGAAARRIRNFDDVAQAALDIVRRTGRVTNITLREVVPITSDEAREVFQALMERGELVRRGVKRGTHYVLPEPTHSSDDADAVDRVSTPSVPPSAPPPAVSPPRGQRPSETALRRLLRRGR